MDRISDHVLRGFGAVPKRGAEVGGVLVGSIQPASADAPAAVVVEDFELVECEYRHGPSYLLSDRDEAAFAEARAKWQTGGPRVAVGFFRSHTRDGLSLSPEDLERMDRYFPDPEQIVLLIKPYGSKPSLAGFFIREDGAFPAISELEFPFRRRESADPGDRRRLDRLPAPRREIEIEPVQVPDAAPPRRRLAPRNAIWMLALFVVLLLGFTLGMLISLVRQPAGGGVQDFALGLTVTRSDDNLSVRWNRGSPAIRAAERGEIEIEDGGTTVARQLDSLELKNGSLLYRHSSGAVRFRLIVYPKARIALSETVDWKQ